MSDDFLPRAHSKRLGELEPSNWKSLRDGRNIHRIDPAIREVVKLLNGKGYRTFSSCSGGIRRILDGRSTVTRADTLHSLRRRTWPSRCTLVFERRIVISPLKRRRSSTTETGETGRLFVLDSTGNYQIEKNTG